MSPTRFYSMNRSTPGRGLAGALSVLLMSAALAACGSSGGGSSNGGTLISGSGVKGPLANAMVNAYAFDMGAVDFKGQLLDTGRTTDNAAIEAVEIPSGHNGAVVLEVVADDATVDLTTRGMPLINRLLTVIATDDLDGASVYPTPLTTVAFRLAGVNGASGAGPYSAVDDGDGELSESEFLASFRVASRQTASTLGFGLETDLDLNTTPPLITGTTVTPEEQAAVARYRTAIEALGAVVQNMRENAEVSNPDSTVDNDALLTGLAEDLSDGIIDGQIDGDPIEAFADVDDVAAEVTADPAMLTIPGTDISVADVEQELIREKADTGNSTDTSELEEGGSANVDPALAKTMPDSDQDGRDDRVDNCPLATNSDQADFDGDGVGDACDDDADGDGVLNEEDAFPEDPNESADSDGDGVGDNGDNCPITTNPNQADLDGDGTGNACDDDRDGDNAPNWDDAFPDDPAEDTDSDSDGMGDNADAFPDNPDEFADSDGDGMGDNADAFPDNPDEFADSDGDGVGDNTDNCPNVANSDQADSNGDGTGDACPSETGAVWDEFSWDRADWQ